VEINKTERGFKFCLFKDYYGVECSIQQSSIATDDCIWIGANEVRGEVTGNNRMHLSREQIASLIPILQRFVDTGDLG
jgi:hypothetical protein